MKKMMTFDDATIYNSGPTHRPSSDPKKHACWARPVDKFFLFLVDDATYIRTNDRGIFVAQQGVLQRSKRTVFFLSFSAIERKIGIGDIYDYYIEKGLRSIKTLASLVKAPSHHIPFQREGQRRVTEIPAHTQDTV
jgi:hypothetical protein